jgi:UDP-N-acetylmuramoyl-L-alanyl-D-glutamate--2,6-diaminopimelate ligase
MKGFKAPEKIEQITDRKKAIEAAIYNSTPNTMILIAGKGHETYQEVAGKRYDFDDRKVAQKALGHKNDNTNKKVT